jgi:hypothetical protein
MVKKRKHQRVKVEIRAASKDNRSRGFTRNVSAGGCFVEKSEDCNLLPIGSKVPLFLEIPGEYAYIEIDGIVKHHGKKKEGMGICFEPTSCGIQSLIDGFLQNHT